MFILYFIALIPILFGAILSAFNDEICWSEWIIGAGLALIMAGGFHLYSYKSQVGDTETWSGQIVEAHHIPTWRERYSEAIYRTETYQSGTDSNGNPTYSTRQVFSHYETRHHQHPPKWTLTSNISTTYNVSESHYNDVVQKFGGEEKRKGVRRTGKTHSKMVGGDPYDYYGVNKNNWIEPVNKPVKFENRVKASKNVFNSYKVNEDAKGNLHPYPYSEPKIPWTSNRLLGTAHKTVDPLKWEQLNAALGPIKKINLILVGFENQDERIADDQIAFWLGGKKNDLIIMYGEGWSRVFGWSESELCKQNAAQLFLNPNDPELLTKLKKEIVQNYEKVDWSEKYKYIQIQPQTIHVVIFMIVLFITQIGLYVFFHLNDLTFPLDFR